MKYDVSDNELIYLYRCQNKRAYDVLIERYRKRMYWMIEKCKNEYNLKYIDFEDCYQSCFVAFLKCIENFNKEGIFYSYVMSAVENVLHRLMEKEVKSNNMISLEDYLVCAASDTSFASIASDASYAYKNNELKKFIDNNFDELSKKIIEYRCMGYNCREIVDITKTSRKQVYNRMTKIKNTFKSEGYH